MQTGTTPMRMESFTSDVSWGESGAKYLEM